MGQTLRFNSPDTQKLTVRWSIFGCGEYAWGAESAPAPGTKRGPLPRADIQLAPDPLPENYVLPNVALDVYLNKWVQIRPFLYLGVARYSTEYQRSGPSLFV